MKRPIAIDALYRELGVAKRNGRYDVAYICSNEHKQINKWAKYKPERHHSPRPLNDELRKYNNFGLRPGMTYTSVGEVVNRAKANLITDWEYEAPRPGTDRSRLSDFEGYRHNATSPFGVLTGQTLEFGSVGSFPLQIPVYIPMAGAEGLIDIRDFSMGEDAYKDWYAGVILWNDKRTLVKTADTTFAENASWLIGFGNVPQSYKGTYQAVLIISSEKIAPDSWPGNPRICFVGGRVSILITDKKSLLIVSLTGELKTSGTDRLVELRAGFINNASSGSHNFANAYMQVAKDDRGTGAATVATYDSIVVAAGKSETRRKTVNLTQEFRSESDKYRYGRLTAGEYTSGWTMFMEEFDPGGLEFTV